MAALHWRRTGRRFTEAAASASAAAGAEAAAVETLWFVRKAAKLDGIKRIALFGSLATPKVYPKDADVLVTVEDDVDLKPLASLGRKFSGRLQAKGLGSDVFLTDPMGRHIGRTCPWKECGPGIRASCRYDNINIKQE